MALHLEYQAVLGTSLTEVDLAAERIGKFICRFSDSAPASLSFEAIQPQHTFPLELRKFIRFWDDAGTTPDGNPQTSANPLFEGYIWECQPADSNLLRYVAYDPSHMAGREIPVMSAPWNASVGGDPPEPSLGAVPRLIINCAIDNDADFAFERAANRTIGQIIEIVLDDAIYPLRWWAAAPGADVAYQTSDTALFDYIPQEKVVSTNEPIRGFLDRLTQQHYPEYAFRWDPGSHYWRWYSRLSSPQVTLTLNDPAPAEGRVVLSMELHRSLEGRYPAIRYYGPETTTVETFSTLDGTLAAIDAPTILETYTDAGGTDTVEVHQIYQIVDSSKRRGAKMLPSAALVRDSDYHYVSTKVPIFQLSFDGGVTFQSVRSVNIDFQNGIIYFGDGLFTYFWTSESPPGSTQHFFAPNAFRLIWASYTTPLMVRAPSSGFSGTSHTVAGQTNELRLYDEMLAVGYNRVGTPVTTGTRLAAFQKLADAQLAARKDIVHTGGCTLEGLQYEFCRLNRQINLAAVDENGDSLTTGWEGIKAVVSDVEYDYEEMITTLTFSQEALNLWGDNADLLKTRLKISGVLEKIRIFNFYYTWRTERSIYSNKASSYQVHSGVVYNDYDLWWDRQRGTFEQGITPGGGIS